MSNPTPEELRFARLASLADGDPAVTLPAASRDAAGADAGGDAALAQRIAEQGELQAACARVMDRPEHRCPDALRAQLAALTVEPEQSAERSPVIGRIGSRGWIGTFAAAALIAISTVAVVGLLQNTRPGPQAAGQVSVVQVLNSDQAAALGSRHKVCGSDPSNLFQRDRFPETLDGLNDRLVNVIDSALGSARLDLTKLGFTYRGAGHCSVPGPGAVHVVYGNDAGQALSLWLRPNDGQLNLAQGQVYGPPADGPQAGQIRVWRSGDVVMYLVGDLPEDVELAQPQLALLPV